MSAEQEFKEFPYGTVIETRHGIWITQELPSDDPRLPGLLLDGWEPYAGSAFVAPSRLNPQEATLARVVFLRTQEDLTLARLADGRLEVLPPHVTPTVAPEDKQGLLDTLLDNGPSMAP